MKIEYYEPIDEKLKGTIFLNRKCNAVLLLDGYFEVITPNRTFNFQIISNNSKEVAQVWVNTINNAIKSLK